MKKINFFIHSCNLIYLFEENNNNIRVSEEGWASVKIGKPLAKKSIIVAKISGFTSFQSTSSSTLKKILLKKENY